MDMSLLNPKVQETKILVSINKKMTLIFKWQCKKITQQNIEILDQRSILINHPNHIVGPWYAYKNLNVVYENIVSIGLAYYYNFQIMLRYKIHRICL